ncbi:hypothetical protein L210DRAFT_3571366, partial [Boletus edulis BED1]
MIICSSRFARMVKRLPFIRLFHQVRCFLNLERHPLISSNYLLICYPICSAASPHLFLPHRYPLTTVHQQADTHHLEDLIFLNFPLFSISQVDFGYAASQVGRTVWSSMQSLGGMGYNAAAEYARLNLVLVWGPASFRDERGGSWAQGRTCCACLPTLTNVGITRVVVGVR